MHLLFTSPCLHIQVGNKHTCEPGPMMSSKDCWPIVPLLYSNPKLHVNFAYYYWTLVERVIGQWKYQSSTMSCTSSLNVGHAQACPSIILLVQVHASLEFTEIQQYKQLIVQVLENTANLTGTLLLYLPSNIFKCFPNSVLNLWNIFLCYTL